LDMDDFRHFHANVGIRQFACRDYSYTFHTSHTTAFAIRSHEIWCKCDKERRDQPPQCNKSNNFSFWLCSGLN
jgi:hypothetical protein